jgi:hypothetical protein
MSLTDYIEAPRLASVHKLRERIAALRRISLKEAAVDQLEGQLTLLFRGYALRSPVINAGTKYHRGVKWNERPAKISQLSYPPAEFVTRYGRANEPGQSMFYASLARDATLYELRSKAGDHVAISRWSLKQNIILNNAGFTSAVMQRLKSTRETLNALFEDPLKVSPGNRLVHEFLADEFTKDVSTDEEHEYKISVAISRKLLGNITGTPAHITQSDRFGGILYPALAARGNSDNVVLRPAFVDQYLQLEWVEFLRVDAAVDATYKVTILDCADCFSRRGEIEWKGRHPHWVIKDPGVTYTAKVINGRWVVEDETGRAVDPS